MEIYIASVAGVLSTLLLGVIYLADRYEREPIDLIQNYFLSGVVGQLVMILAASVVVGQFSWTGPWILVTVAVASVLLPYQLHRQPEMDERFDGIVYSVAFAGGAACVIHIFNLPRVILESPYRAALAAGAVPDLRDLLILATSPGFSDELGRGLVVILAAVLFGAVLGTMQLRGAPLWQRAAGCLSVALAAAGLDLAFDGSWVVRGALTVTAIVVALWVKRSSVFRNRPVSAEREVLIMGVKTVLMVFGAAILTTVILQSVVDRPEEPERIMPANHGDRGLEQVDG